MWDFVPFWKFLMGFCAFLTKSQEELSKCTQSHEELPNIHNPTRNFQKCTKSQEKLPNMQKIPRGSSENAKNSAFLEVPRGVVYIWEFLVGLCTF
jgi:hypothetical protein